MPAIVPNLGNTRRKAGEPAYSCQICLDTGLMDSPIPKPDFELDALESILFFIPCTCETGRKETGNIRYFQIRDAKRWKQRHPDIPCPVDWRELQAHLETCKQDDDLVTCVEPSQ